MKKKTLCLLFAVLLLLQLISCGSASQNSSIDKEENSTQTSTAAESDIPVILIDSPNFNQSRNYVLQYAQYLHTGYRVQLKVLPHKSEEREAELSALRVEIMAGGGPDAFILPCDYNAFLNDGGQRVPFFTNVEKAMHSRIFLPLDDLIAQSKYFNLEDHHEVIMKAGKTEEGQLVLPLLYSLDTYFVYAENMDNPNIELNTFEDVRTCDDPQVSSFLRRKAFNWFGSQYTQLVDYETESLTLTPEQLQNDLKPLVSVPLSTDNDLTEPDLAHSFNDYALYAWEKESENICILSVPNENGGLTAKITAFSAINRNTEHAEEVFKFIELLYSEEVQNNEGVYLNTDENGENGRWYGNMARPCTMLIGSTSGIPTHKRAYPDIQGELVSELTEKVNSARFESDLDGKLSTATCALSVSTVEDAELKSFTEEICDEMEMILAE